MNPLPLIVDKHGVRWLLVDNSFITIACPRAKQYMKIEGRCAKGEHAATNFGTAMHSGMEARYKRADYAHVSGAVEQAMFDAATKHLTEKPQPEDEYRNLDLATDLIRAYNKKHLTESFEVLRLEDGRPVVEMPFCVPLTADNGKPQAFALRRQTDVGLLTRYICVMYTGKIDLLIRQYNQIFTLDHKTTFQFGTGFWNDQNMASQHVGYAWAIDQIFRPQGVTTSGYVVNAIRTAKPSKTRPKPDNTDLERNIFYLTPERKEEWRENLIVRVENFLDYYNNGYFPMHTESCVGKYSTCQYYDVCSIPAPQRAAMLSSGLFEDHQWSPLNKGGQMGTILETEEQTQNKTQD